MGGNAGGEWWRTNFLRKLAVEEVLDYVGAGVAEVRAATLRHLQDARLAPGALQVNRSRCQNRRRTCELGSLSGSKGAPARDYPAPVSAREGQSPKPRSLRTPPQRLRRGRALLILGDGHAQHESLGERSQHAEVIARIPLHAPEDA